MLAHGAGAPMTSPFMETMAGLLAERGVGVVRFEFAYMAARRAGGKRRPPPKAETLMDDYRELAAEIAAAAPAGQRLFIGGKSMGGRVASLVADELWRAQRIGGLVCLGYPFHPPGVPDKLRTSHLEALTCPTLIVQGERDPFGTRGEVESYRLSPSIRFTWLGDGDHDFGPRGGSGFTRKGNLAAASDAVAGFVIGTAPRHSSDSGTAG
jgi:predicted alpha/beta-hydrolase family hydrolase